jgi:hypothetical protein
MEKEIKGYLIIAGITLLTLIVYKNVILPMIPATLANFLPKV